MINELKNVPELRFSNFCDEWVNYKLGEIVDIRGRIGFRGYTKSDIINKEDGGVLTFSPTNIIYNKLKNTVHDTYITKEKYEESPEIMVKTGDILFVKTGSTLGKSTLVANLNEEATVNPQIVVMRVKVFFHQKFTSTYLTLNKILRQVAQTRIGGAIPTLTESEIKKFQVSFPVYEEQQKIGEFFSKLDRQIELEEQKLEKLKEQKKGYMQKIFSQELRFKDENGEHYPNWKKITIKEVANLTAGKSKKNENTGKYIIMDMGTVTKNGTILTHKSTPYESDLLNKGDLVMPKDDIGGGHIIGKTAFIPDSHKYVLGDHVYRLEIKKCNSLFLHYYINSDIVNRSLKRKVTGSAQLGLNRKSVEEEVIKTPCLEEQEKIGILFNKIDNLIELQTNKIEQLKQRKQGLLQKMFI